MKTAARTNRVDLIFRAFSDRTRLRILNLLRGQLAQSGMVLSIVEMMTQLTDIKEVTLLYPAPRRSQEPLVRTELSKMNNRQKQMVSTLGLNRYHSH